MSRAVEGFPFGFLPFVGTWGAGGSCWWWWWRCRDEDDTVAYCANVVSSGRVVTWTDEKFLLVEAGVDGLDDPAFDGTVRTLEGVGGDANDLSSSVGWLLLHVVTT